MDFILCITIMYSIWFHIMYFILCMYYVPYYVELYYANTECYIELSLTRAEAAGVSVHTNYYYYLHYLQNRAVLGIYNWIGFSEPPLS